MNFSIDSHTLFLNRYWEESKTEAVELSSSKYQQVTIVSEMKSAILTGVRLDNTGVIQLFAYWKVCDTSVPS